MTKAKLEAIYLLQITKYKLVSELFGLVIIVYNDIRDIDWIHQYNTMEKASQG